MQQQSGTPINLAASGTVSKAAGTLLGFYVNNKTAGATLVIGNGATSAATAVTGTITPLIGYHETNYYLPAGCYITIAVQAMDITFFFAAG